MFFGFDVDSLLLQYSMVSKNTIEASKDTTYDLRKSEVISDKGGLNDSRSHCVLQCKSWLSKLFCIN